MAIETDASQSASPTLRETLDGPRWTLVERIRKVFTEDVERVLLIQPPQFPEELLDLKIAKNKRYYNYPPYGLGLLCTNLKARGYATQILDLNFDLLDFISSQAEEVSHQQVTDLWQDKIRQSIAEFRPDVVGISCMFTMSHEITKKVVRLIKGLAPALPVVAGGVHVTNAPDIILAECPEIDFVSLYESDQTRYRGFQPVAGA